MHVTPSDPAAATPPPIQLPPLEPLLHSERHHETPRTWSSSYWSLVVTAPEGRAYSDVDAAVQQAARASEGPAGALGVLRFDSQDGGAPMWKVAPLIEIARHAQDGPFTIDVTNTTFDAAWAAAHAGAQIGAMTWEGATATLERIVDGQVSGLVQAKDGVAHIVLVTGER
ncbi:MAG: hypothetical protein JWM90_1990 [Thermoleophilia bacterium]|nr:hypothetical protein [Thermoleophilia bacterium]